MVYRSAYSQTPFYEHWGAVERVGINGVSVLIITGFNLENM